jgi:GTP pyrophosphokinase
MHRSADYGIASHWRYKESAKQDVNFDDKVAWLRQLIEWQSELGSEEFLESLKTDIFIDQVFIFSPKGDVVPLPRGATPLDFAYRIHTEVGHRCIGAKVNGKLMSLNHKLKNGDIVEIMTTKTGRGPSLDWLNSDLGYVQTSHAREKIKQWFKKQEKTQNIERGRQLLERELKRIGATPMNSEEMAQLFNYDTYEDFLAAFGSGNVTPHQLMIKLVEEPEPPPVVPQIAPATEKKLTSSGVQVLGVGDLLTHLAGCCNPLPGDDIIGYITRSEGITIHRKDCMNIINEQEKERLVKTSWGPVAEVYPIKIRIDVWNRVGVLRDITTVIAEEKINISSISTTEQEDVTSVHVTLEIKNMSQLTHLLSKIQSVRGVINAVRYSQIKTGS